MSKSNTFENDMLKLWFNGVPVANLADNAASGPLANLYASLHLADPGEAGDQLTNEATYTGYARVPIPRSALGFAVAANVVTLVAAATFPPGTAGSGTITHFAIGTAASGAGKIMYSGAVAPQIPSGSGITPELTPGTTVTED
jgi:hypothetical protein